MSVDGSLFTIAPGERFPITLGFGEVVPETAAYGPHTGIDVGAPLGSGLDALLGGTVTAVRTEKLGGLEVQVTAPTGESVLFAHLSEAAVAPGDVVSPGTFIGYTGASGSAVTGPHVHIETRSAAGALVDPLSILGSDALSGAPSSSTTPAADKQCPPGSVLRNGVCYSGGGFGPPVDFLPVPIPGTAGYKPNPAANPTGGIFPDLGAAIGAAAGNALSAVVIVVIVLVLVVAGGRRVIGE